MIKDKVLNIASEAYIKGTMFIFMVFLARNLGNHSYAAFVGAQALLTIFLPISNMGMETSYLLDPIYRKKFTISEITASKVLFVFVGMCGYLILTYWINRTINNVSLLFAIIYASYALNAEYILLVNKGWKKIAYSNVLFGCIVLLSYFAKEILDFTLILLMAFAIKFMYQSYGTLILPKLKEIGIRPAKVSRYIFLSTFVSVLYLNILKLILFGTGNELVLKEYDLVMRYLAIGELMFVVALRQYASELHKLEIKKILYLQLVLLLLAILLLFSPLWHIYTSLIGLDLHSMQLKALLAVYLFLAMNNQLISQKLQSMGKAKDTFYAGLLIVFLLLTILLIGLNLTNLLVCIILIIVMKTVEALFTFYKLLC